MAKKMIRELATELTAPRAASKPLARSTHSHMQHSSSNDPIWDKLEREELNGSPNIDNTGRGLIRVRNHAFEINDRYESTADKEEAEREEYGGLTKFEAYQATVMAVHHAYDSPSVFATQSVVFLPKPTALPEGYKAGLTLTGKDGKSFTAIYDEKGDVAYYDTGSTCAQNPNGISATIAARPIDKLLDDSQKFNINYKIDAHGNMVKRTAEEANFQLTLARIENQALKFRTVDEMIADMSFEAGEKATRESIAAAAAKKNAPAFGSSVASGIETSVAPSATFGDAMPGDAAPAAQSKSIMFQNQPPKAKAPWETPDKTSKVSANEPKFELTA